ncbi:MULTISPECIES: 4'-phosphopantetheinyl transferase family protein [Bacillus cereus group]|uniref:4'-phosphopantetheinyl transferase family protein n=1 Tax=Bacillus cereus group TaxID=86661 RepID=UPI000FE2CA23|nr:4'-phosphopantetheinyl transferase superfamily protein [Bacillus cereus]
MQSIFFTKQEYEYLFQIKDHKEKLNYFYQIWTIKESYVKAIGKGLSVPLNSFKIGEDSEQGANWFIKQYMIDELYCLSVCAKTSEFPEYINHQLDFSQLYNLYKQIKNN